MGAPCSRSRSLLIRQDVTDDHARFDHQLDEDDEPTPVLILSLEDYADLGSPEQITLTLEPGDLLNG